MSKSNVKSNAKSATAATKAPRVRKQKEVAAPAAEIVVAAPEVVVAAPVVETPAADVAARKIEKDRPEQNGVKQPSIGGLCRAVWDFCTAASAEVLVDATQVKAAAAENGWNPNNAMIEYYQWRKFNGIRGRQSKPVAPAEVAAQA